MTQTKETEKFNSPVLQDQYSKMEFQMIHDLNESQLGIVIKGIYFGYEVEVFQKKEHLGEIWCYTESILNPYTGIFQMWFRESEVDFKLYEEIYGGN